MQITRFKCLVLAALIVSGSMAQEQPQQPVAENPPAEAPPAEAAAEPAPDLKLGLMPKHETGALRFLEAHPEYDGRGTVVAIFDTGVDPGAAGLQLTSDGKPKVIDLVDATGSGDVEMNVVAKPADGKITGRTGRVLKLGADWKIPSGEVRLGVKAGFELFPKELLPRVTQHRREEFLKVQKKLEAELRRELEFFDAKTSKVEKAELERRLERLVAAGQSFEDVGPIFDCVVFHDGTHWRAVVDTDEDGDLGEEKLLTNFRTERQYATFDDVSLLNFAVNIYDNGKTLSIVIDSNPHGTHVAGIVAANFPEQPEWNGVAPGAQIVSVKIGDTYLDGMETPAGLLRAVKAVLDNKCDLINMSFGEPTKTPDRGLVVKLYDELVDKHGVMFLASAGNAGPALSTVGAPGGTTTSIIGVGAYVSPEMAAAQYALRERVGETAFSWTSRGPTFDGDLGVNLFAPGAAIAPVPCWTLTRSMRMNGTSMASPNCCGNFALVLSGLKQMNLKYTPNSVERAFANTARRIESSDVFAQGAGLIQVDAAFEALIRDVEKKAEQQRFEIKLAQLAGARGIYLREPLEVGEFCDSREYVVQVTPTFNDDVKSAEKHAFQIRCTLESTDQWVRCGEQVTLTSSGQSLNVFVDPRGLSPGAHFAEVLGFDADDADHVRGPLFRIPVTVCRTIPAVRDDAEVVLDVPTLRGQQLNETIPDFEPGRIERRFIPVPSGASWVDLRIKQTPRENGGRSRLFMLHAVQVIPGLSYRDAERNAPTPLQAGIEVVQSFPVEPGRTLELAIAQFWSSLGTCDVEYELLFRGLSVDQREVRLAPGDVAARVEVRSEYEPEHVAPKANLSAVRRQMKPTSASIKSASPERDNFDPARAFEVLTLSYEFDQPEPGSITPRFGATDDLLYDSEFGGVLWTIFDANGRRVGTDDVWPHAVSLAKGKHVLKLELRHFDRAKLDALKSLSLTIERSIGAISLPVFASMPDAQQNGQRFSPRLLLAGERTRLFIGNVTAGQLPGFVRAGDVLVGTITYGGDSQHRGTADRPGGYVISVAAPVTDNSSVPLVPIVPSEPLWVVEDVAAPNSADERIARTVRDAKRQLLHTTSIDSDRALFDKLAEDLLKETPNDLTVLVSKLRKLDASAKRDDNLEEVIAAADAVLAQLNGNDIAVALALKPGNGDAEGAKKRKQAEALKPLLIDTLYRKGRAVGHQELPEVLAKKPIADKKTHDAVFEKTFAELQRWVDTTDATYFLLHMRRTSKQGRYGESLQLLERHFSKSSPNYWHLEKRRELFEKLNWPHLTEPALRARLIAFPNGEPK